MQVKAELCSPPLHKKAPEPWRSQEPIVCLEVFDAGYRLSDRRGRHSRGRLRACGRIGRCGRARAGLNVLGRVRIGRDTGRGLEALPCAHALARGASSSRRRGRNARRRRAPCRRIRRRRRARARLLVLIGVRISGNSGWRLRHRRRCAERNSESRQCGYGLDHRRSFFLWSMSSHEKKLTLSPTVPMFRAFPVSPLN